MTQIIPVVAEEYKINDEISVFPFGLEELCTVTLECADTAKRINEANRRKMALEQKRFTANMIVGATVTSATVVGAAPIGFADALLLVPLETAMTKGILSTYNVKIPNDLITAIIGSSAITNVAKMIVEPLKALPIAGSVVNGAVAGCVVLALGEAVIATAYAIHIGKIDANKFEEVQDFVEKKLKESKISGELISFMTDNIKDIKDKNAKDIVTTFLDAKKKEQ